MAQYSNLKAYIEEKIYENGTQAITGDILQDVLKVMTDDLGEFYQTGGVASPSTDPGTPDAKVIYFATEAGTYTNFGGITLAAGEVALLIFETRWTKVELNVLSSANGGVKTANLADGAVTTEKIAGGAVETAKIANNAVTSGKVADGAIGTAKIADGAIDADKIAANAVESAKIKNGAVTEGKINDGAVTAGKVAANAVTTAKIADDAVTTAKLNDGAVTEDKIATDAVTSGKVKDGAIGTAKIAAGAVTHAKIGAGAVEESNIKDGAVTSDKIANGAVGSDQLAEGAFSAENLADGSVTTDKLADGAVTAEKIADGAVTAGKFADGSVSTAKLASGAVITEKIGDGMVTRQKLADSSVGTSKIIDGAVTTDKVADGAITDAKLENPVSVSQNTLTAGGTYLGEMSTTYDVTLHSGQTFASLSALLSDANLNTLIPLVVRKGGMSIKFVCSSDNKYVRYNLLAESFTTDVSQWAIDDAGVYVENPEFVYVKTDAQDRILWAIKKDGNVLFGAGVPSQLVEYIHQKISEYHGDDIISFLDGLEEGDKTLRELLNERGEYIENPEWVDVKTDSEDKILEGIKTDGTKVIDIPLEVNAHMDVQGVRQETIDNPEFVQVTLDKDGKIIEATRKDGKKVFYEGVEGLETSIIEIIMEYLGVENINNKVFSILGDSISTFDQVGYKIDGYVMYYPNGDVDEVGDTWWGMLIDKANCSLDINASYAGSTAASNTIGFSPRVPLLGNPELIFIALGTNDSGANVPIGDFEFNANSYDLSKFAPAYIKGMKDIIAAYPEARIVCLSFYMRNEYANAIKKIADYYGAYYIDLRYSVADVHPDKAGMTAVYDKVSKSGVYSDLYDVMMQAKHLVL